MGYLSAYRRNTIQNKDNVILLLKTAFATATAMGTFYYFAKDLQVWQSIIFKFACLGNLISIMYGIMGLLVYSHISSVSKVRLKKYSKVDFDFVFLAQACALMVSFIFMISLFAI